MSLLDVATKYKFTNIGKASATGFMIALASTSFAPLTVGVPGKIVHFILTLFFMAMASLGLVVMNVGVDWIKTRSERNDFDGSFDDAFAIINEGNLTPEKIKEADDKVIAAHNKFGTFGKLREPSDS